MITIADAEMHYYDGIITWESGDTSQLRSSGDSYQIVDKHNPRKSHPGVIYVDRRQDLRWD